MEDHGWIGWILPHFRPTTCPTCHRQAPRKSGSALLGGSWRIDPAGKPPGGWLGSTSPPAWPAGPGLLSNGNKPAFRNNMISAYGFLNLNRIYIYIDVTPRFCSCWSILLGNPFQILENKHGNGGRSWADSRSCGTIISPSGHLDGWEPLG